MVLENNLQNVNDYQGFFSQFFDVKNLDKFPQKIAELVDLVECYHQWHQDPPQITSSSFSIVEDKVATLLGMPKKLCFCPCLLANSPLLCGCDSMFFIHFIPQRMSLEFCLKTVVERSPITTLIVAVDYAWLS